MRHVDCGGEKREILIAADSCAKRRRTQVYAEEEDFYSIKRTNDPLGIRHLRMCDVLF